MDAGRCLVIRNTVWMKVGQGYSFLPSIPRPHLNQRPSTRSRAGNCHEGTKESRKAQHRKWSWMARRNLRTRRTGETQDQVPIMSLGKNTTTGKKATKNFLSMINRKIGSARVEVQKGGKTPSTTGKRGASGLFYISIRGRRNSICLGQKQSHRTGERALDPDGLPKKTRTGSWYFDKS